MGIPQAIQDQVKEADEIQKSLLDTDKTEAVKPEPVKTAQQKVGDNELKAQLEKSEERFKSYKKMYDKHVHSSRVDIEAKDGEITRLNAEIEGLKANASTTKQGDTDSDVDAALEDISVKFGSEFVDAVSNLSKGQLIRNNAALTSRIDAIEKKVAGHKEQPANNDKAGESEGNGYTFQSRLADLVPNWTQINNSKQFHTWLDGLESDGRRRQDHLKAAQGRDDVIAVAKFFYQFEDENPHRNEASGKDILPDTKPGGTDLEADEIIYAKEISEFYREKALGKIEPEEAIKIQAKIDHAMRTGNIRQ